MTKAVQSQRTCSRHLSLRWAGVKLLLLAFMVTSALPSPAQTFTTIVRFRQSYGIGGAPYSAPTQGKNGNMYGAVGYGGVDGSGYEITSKGSLLVLYDPSGIPVPGTFGNLLLTASGNFYSTSFWGGNEQSGAVFEMTPTGEATLLYQFCGPTCVYGSSPYDTLALGPDGNFYGTTLAGGASEGINGCGDGCGTVFTMTPEGELTTLHNFCLQSGCPDGGFPFDGLTLGANGNFYGTTSNGGAHDGGTVFEITPAGELTTLYNFCSQPSCTDGWNPRSGLILAADGNFYGTTYLGGSDTTGCVDSGCGTVFKITPTGTLTTLYSFCSQTMCADGSEPTDALMQATDGNFYGTTQYRGGKNSGTLFKITPTGTLTTLHSFCSQPGCSDGAQPLAGLTQATNGVLYGSTSQGGIDESGTIFTFSNSLPPFAETVPAFGKVGAEVIILGNNLTGTTSVRFNGTSAAFTVLSDTDIRATVPSRATSGTVEVTTPRGTLNSNVAFMVLASGSVLRP